MDSKKLTIPELSAMVKGLKMDIPEYYKARTAQIYAALESGNLEFLFCLLQNLHHQSLHPMLSRGSHILADLLFVTHAPLLWGTPLDDRIRGLQKHHNTAYSVFGDKVPENTSAFCWDGPDPCADID